MPDNPLETAALEAAVEVAVEMQMEMRLTIHRMERAGLDDDVPFLEQQIELFEEYKERLAEKMGVVLTELQFEQDTEIEIEEDDTPPN